MNEQLAELVKTDFDNIIDEFDSLLGRIESTTDSLETALDIVEAKGNFASKSYFEDLMAVEQENLAMLREEYSTLQDAFEEAMSTGLIDESSEAFYEMQEQIRDVESAIQDSYLSLLEFKNQLWENDWSVFEKTIEYLDEITKESDFLVDLLSLNENDLFSKKSGKLNDYGMSVGGLHAMDYNVYMADAQAYAAKIAEINKELANDPYNTILLDKRNEYLEAQRESIKAANEEKKNIQSLIEESYKRQLEILQELIDKRKEALQTEKDLYSYEKGIKEQTKRIASYQKQLAALSGDDSEETQSKRQQLQDSLQQAQDDLAESEYERWIQDQEKLLDDLYLEWEEILNGRLDNIDGLLTDMIDSANANADTINQVITEASGNVGYTITDGMADIWNTNNAETKEVVSNFKNSVDGGLNKIASLAQAATGQFTNTMTTTNSYIKSIYDLISKIVTKSENEKPQNVSPAQNPSTVNTNTVIGSSTAVKPTTTTTAKPTTTNKTTSSSTSSSAKKGDFFVYKADSYPKSKLNINTSIVDESLIVHPII